MNFNTKMETGNLKTTFSGLLVAPKSMGTWEQRRYRCTRRIAIKQILTHEHAGFQTGLPGNSIK